MASGCVACVVIVPTMSATNALRSGVTNNTPEASAISEDSLPNSPLKPGQWATRTGRHLRLQRPYATARSFDTSYLFESEVPPPCACRERTLGTWVRTHPVSSGFSKWTKWVWPCRKHAAARAERPTPQQVATNIVHCGYNGPCLMPIDTRHHTVPPAWWRGGEFERIACLIFFLNFSY